MHYRIGFTRRPRARGTVAVAHAHLGKYRNKDKTTALALCGAPLEVPPGDFRPQPGSYGAGRTFRPDYATSCRRCRKMAVELEKQP